MNSWFKFLMGVSFLIIVAIGLSACSDKDNDNNNGAASDGGSQEISVRINNDPDFLDPHMAEASITYQVILNIFDGLLVGDTDGSLKPALAEEYDISEDGLTYTFDIREGVTFHNGDPLTVEDIQYSFERLMGTHTGEPLSSNFENIDALETPDENTFVIKLKEPNSAFLTYLTALNSAILPKSNDGKHNENPIGTGPFQYENYSPENNMVVVKNENYWKEGLPYLDKVTFVFQPDDQTALLSLQSGQIDLVAVGAHRVPEVEDQFNLTYQDSNSVLLVGFNHDREPFNDIRVRQAINYAVNKDDIIEATFSGYATKIGSNMSPAMADVYKEGLEDAYARDVAKAKDLLAEAGYPNGFQTTLSISSHAGMYTNVAQVIVENLKDIGIDVEIEVVEWGVWLERIYQGRDYDMTVIDFTGELSPYETIKRYISGAGNNFFNFENAEFDELMQDVIVEQDADRQNELYGRAQEILSEEAAAVYLADYQIIWALNPELEGYKTYPYFFHDLEEVRYTE
ncbi:ABC transporter substrate-binding protein [Ornithinibacillus halotolerans]|uniref:Diguanylate phosphodiesterase n=1 Tax=Ornithinibacillus halotolerans TaxID=1274357 RepID=A0A916RQ72_9BACI|nr:ABC transporter substrate-binding protein [Ornithinibacillus halotolerans]GGA65010.1 diguanylate phosphodiesterase [Ornithinibacillus halotolerans]